MARLIDADALVENIKSEIDDDKEIYPDDKPSILFRALAAAVINTCVSVYLYVMFVMQRREIIP